jgi:uncharacterized phiE125 gp8 family phage protein
MLIKTAAATYLPVTVERARERLHVDFTDDDADIEVLIRAAVEALEARTGLVLATSGFEYRTSCWPRQIDLPAAPIRNVTSVKYLDEALVEQTVPSQDWYWVPGAAGGAVFFNSTFAAPALADRPDAVRIVFEAGYDDPAATPGDPRLAFPPSAEMAILFLVGSWYAHRESIIVGVTPLPVPQTFDWIAAQLRVYR